MYFSISPSAPSTSYSTASPMDIPTTSSRSPSCAFPSWPRRSSLSSNSSDSSEYHNHSFIISDEELFGAVFEDSPVSTPASDMSRSPVGSYHDRERESPIARYVIESGSMMREVVRQEKERRERQQQRRRSASSGSKKRKASKKMSVIAE